MTMLIIRFHRLIQNKILWVIFCFLIVISFVWWGAVSPGDDSPQAANPPPGFLDGDPVDPGLYQQTKFSTWLGFLLSSGRQVSYTSISQEIESLAWRRLVSLRTAEDLNLVASNQEVQSTLLQQPSFQQGGRFDNDSYTSFITRDLSALAQQPVSKEFFERHIQEELTLAKLQQMIIQTTLVPKYDIAMTFNRVTESFQVDYAVLYPNLVEEETPVTEEDVSAYFESHVEDFRIPKRVRVDYIEFHVADYLDGVTIDEAAVTNYYENNIDQYQELGTDPLLGDLTSTTNLLDDSATTVRYTPIQDVEDEIREQLQLDAGKFRAIEVANDLVYELSPDAYGQAPTFEEVAERANVSIQHSPTFAAYDDLPGIPNNQGEFIRQAFDLYPDPDAYFSNPVIADSTIYVMALQEQLEPRLAAFEEVEAEVRAATKNFAVSRSLNDKANEIVKNIRAAETPPMAGFLEPYGVPVSSSGVFSLTNGLETLSFASTLRREASGLNHGEVSDPVALPEGILILQVTQRTPGTEPVTAALEDEISWAIKSQTVPFLFRQWQDALLEEANFKAYQPPGVEEEDVATEEEEEEESGA